MASLLLGVYEASWVFTRDQHWVIFYQIVFWLKKYNRNCLKRMCIDFAINRSLNDIPKVECLGIWQSTIVILETSQEKIEGWRSRGRPSRSYLDQSKETVEVGAIRSSRSGRRELERVSWRLLHLLVPSSQIRRWKI